METKDLYGLERFVVAQASIYPTALAELHAGKKRTHWMWFVFPQIAGLGMSSTSQRYAIGSLDEARAYLAHPILGPRLQACAEAVLVHGDCSAHDIFGSPDDLKLCSAATLFAQASPPGSIYARLIDQFFGGEPDARTLARL